jgi:DNA-binding transcriptional LysR family regulator
MPLNNVMARMISGSEFLELRAFLAVAEHLSFRAAAASLGISPSAISQQVSGLEARLGLRLLQRTTRSVSLTDDGAALYQQAAPELANLSRALTSAQSRSHDVQGLVRLHAFRTASEMFLDQALPDFLTAFPSVQVDLTVNDAPIGLVSGGYDLSLRLSEVLDSGLTAVPVGESLHQIVVAAPSYLASNEPVERPQDLGGHNCIRWQWPGTTTPEPWQFMMDGRWTTIPVTGNLVVDDRERLRRAAIAGVGLALVTEETVRAPLSSGALSRVLEAWTSEFAGFSLCWNAGKSMSPAVRALIDWLRQPRPGSTA